MRGSADLRGKCMLGAAADQENLPTWSCPSPSSSPRKRGEGASAARSSFYRLIWPSRNIERALEARISIDAIVEQFATIPGFIEGALLQGRGV